MKKKPLTQHKNLTKLFENLGNKAFFTDAIEKWVAESYTLSKIHRRLEILVNIVNLHGYENAWILYDNFVSTTSRKEKIRIRYGDERLQEHIKCLTTRKRGKTVSCWTTEYWINKGLTEEESIEKIKELQRQNSLKRSRGSWKKSGKKLKIMIEYWTDQGYSEEEAKILREPYLSKNTLEGFIERHGPELGKKKYFACIEKYKKSMKDNLGNRKHGGSVSKESKKFFMKIYKICRKLGIKREHIYFGVEGSREFFIRKDGKVNEGRFVDFCIPKLNLCIEYNGVLWHARNEEEWKNPFYDFAFAKQREDEMKLLCEKRNFDLYYVWSDENENESVERIRNIINERMGLYASGEVL